MVAVIFRDQLPDQEIGRAGIGGGARYIHTLRAVKPGQKFWCWGQDFLQVVIG